MDNGVKNKNKFNHIRLDFEQMHTFYNLYMRNKSKRDNVSWLKAYLVYMWIYYWQLLTKVGFGRVRKQDVFDQIGETLIEPKPNVVVNALIRAGMIVWSKSEYKGVTNYCLQCTYLNGKMRNGNINTDQAKDEVIQIESSAKGSADMGEYYQYGKRFYRDNNGESHMIPLDAPQRPNNTAFWDGKQWRESKSDSTEHKEKLCYAYSIWEMQDIKILGNGLICVNGYTLSDKNGEYWDFRYKCRRFIPPFPEYYQEDAFCFCDKDAPPRPTPTAVWWEDEHKWVEIKDIPERPLDF